MWAKPRASLAGMVPGGAMSAAKDQRLAFRLYREASLERTLRLELWYQDCVTSLYVIGQVEAVTPRQCPVRGSPDKTTLSVPFKDFTPVRIILSPK